MNHSLDPSRASVNTRLSWSPVPLCVRVRRLIPSGGYVGLGEFPVPIDPTDMVELIRLAFEQSEFTANFSQVELNGIVQIVFLIGTSQSHPVRIQVTRKPTIGVLGLYAILE